MEQCPFCREPDKFVKLLSQMAEDIERNKQGIENAVAKIDGMARVDQHMHYLTRELAEFKADRKYLNGLITSFLKYVKKTGIVP